MDLQQTHPSRLKLELYEHGLLDAVEQDSLAHISSCRRCLERLQRMRAEDATFLARHPPEVGLAKRTLRAAPRRWRWGKWLSLAGGFAVMVIVALAVIRGPASEGDLNTGVRSKGHTIVEVAVTRSGRSFSFHDQPLRPGDVLAFRYTTTTRHLLMLSLERSGKMTCYFQNPERAQSMVITPGKRVTLRQGIELDRYLGPERLVALFSSEPLQVAAVRQAVIQRFRKLSETGRATLDIGRLPFPGDQVSWLLHKEAP